MLACCGMQGTDWGLTFSPASELDADSLVNELGQINGTLLLRHVVVFQIVTS